MPLGDPALVVRLGAARGNDGGRAVRARDADLLARVDFAVPLGGGAGAGGVFASRGGGGGGGGGALFGLREEGGDPGAVDEVDGSREEGEEEEVEEYAGFFFFLVRWVAFGLFGFWGWGNGERVCGVLCNRKNREREKWLGTAVGAGKGKTNICGSKIDVSLSTTATVSLNAAIVYVSPFSSVTTAARFSSRSCGCSSVANRYSTLSFSPAGMVMSL